MEFFIIVLVLAVCGWNIFVQVAARQQVNVPVAISEQAAAQLVVEHFGVMWTAVSGPGHLNYRPKLRMRAPMLSVDFSPESGSACTVSIWMSNAITRYGLVHHAQLAWRKKLQLAGKLRAHAAPEPGGMPA
jgi:hypothetical protein